MTANVTIFHNARCSKSRQTLQLLHDRGVQPTVVEYLKDPPSEEQIASLLTLLDLTPRELMRRQEPVRYSCARGLLIWISAPPARIFVGAAASRRF